MLLCGRIYLVVTVIAVASILRPDHGISATYETCEQTDPGVCAPSIGDRDNAYEQTRVYGAILPIPSLSEDGSTIRPNEYVFNGSKESGHYPDHYEGGCDPSYATYADDTTLLSSSKDKNRDCHDRHDQPDDWDNGDHHAPVPEPSTLMLATAGMTWLVLVRRLVWKKSK